MAYLIGDRDFPGVVDAAFQAIERGRTLLRWWNAFPAVDLLELEGSTRDSRMRYFFSTLLIDGKETTITGCVQEMTVYPHPASGQPPVSLSRWVGDHFLQKCVWTDPDGSPGGFHYRPAMVMDRGGTEPLRVDESMVLRLSDVGPKYDWASARLDLKDYFMALPGALGRHSGWMEPLNREAGYMLFHPEFFASPYPRPKNAIDEYTYGYSVVPWQVLPTPAAYGAGRFHSALKQLRFFLLDDGRLVFEVLFLVAPRCTRVFNFLGFDPVFHAVALLDLLTLKQTNIAAAAHRAVNRYAMGHHGRVHINLLKGMAPVWESTNWQAADAQTASSSSRGR